MLSGIDIEKPKPNPATIALDAMQRIIRNEAKPGVLGQPTRTDGEIKADTLAFQRAADTFIQVFPKDSDSIDRSLYLERTIEDEYALGRIKTALNDAERRRDENERARILIESVEA